MQSHSDEDRVLAELRQLTARVDDLERELAAMRTPSGATVQAAPPPPPAPSPQALVPPATPAPTPSSALRSMAAVEAPQRSLENRLGAQIFNRIGIVALLCAATFGLKLAIDNQWIGPVGRILIGLIAGAGVVLWSERFRRKGFAVFSYSLKAVGTGVLYLSLWAAFQLYHLLPASAVLVGMILVTAWNAYMAWVQDAELLAAYAIAGGLATPLLLSTGGDHEIFLFTYLLAIDIATALLVRLKPWARLLLAAFPATVLYFVGWYAKFYAEPAFAVTTIFVGLFFAVFVCVSLGNATVIAIEATTSRLRRLGHTTREVLLPLGNAAFVSLALYSVMQDSERHWFLPWLMLAISAAYLLITRLPQGAVPAAMHLSLAVVFLTIAIPLKASGHWVTVAWLIEGVALIWVSSRVACSGPSMEHSNASSVLRWLSAASLVLGLGALLASTFWFGQGISSQLFNHHFATALIAVGAFAGAAWICLRARAKVSSLWQEYSRFAFAATVAICAVAVLLVLREITASSVQHPAFASADFGMALFGLAILGGVIAFSIRMALRDESTLLWAQLTAAAVVTINLMALLTGVREIRSLWPVATAGSDVELQRGLAVSAFLMLYGAALLTIGFWKRSSFIRWQALGLLVFSIAKTFLYDMRSLSQGYRFASLLGLGALLMAISFAYQKDWLALRNPQSPTGSDAKQGAEQ
ncbi:MAG: DUF2339 domain-containing protein [Edaphobacter sp.]|uniref:DUF2339 domain-containing protein n=1 Tax=Edaphobacter sp. TaxID=1934404 RepID=UPI0023994B5B|nr:DUF2339 domain-containing protein [Edaphobacter sp.]MDE1176501.1 DUF2339 domain-containing protein [Edaphobacter sp.]